MANGIDLVFQIYETIWFVIIWFWWAIFGAYVVAMKIKWKNYPVEAIIIEKRGDNLIKTNDRAGKYTDKYTDVTGYRLQKAKDTIPVVNFDWVLHNDFKPTTIMERFTALLRGNIGTIFLFRYGSKQYKPIKIKQGENIKTIFKEIKDKNGDLSFIKIYEPFDPRNKLGSLDFEVVDWDNMNFMVQEQRASITRRTKRGEFLKQIVVPLVMIGVALVFVIIMIKYGYDYAINIKGTSPQASSAPATKPDIPIIKDLFPGE